MQVCQSAATPGEGLRNSPAAFSIPFVGYELK